ncbi:hypothetical protein F4703DRAFT_1798180 [Phycomyces blakesleeanus]
MLDQTSANFASLTITANTTTSASTTTSTTASTTTNTAVHMDMDPLQEERNQKNPAKIFGEEVVGEPCGAREGERGAPEDPCGVEARGEGVGGAPSPLNNVTFLRADRFILGSARI